MTLVARHCHRQRLQDHQQVCAAQGGVAAKQHQLGSLRFLARIDAAHEIHLQVLRSELASVFVVQLPVAVSDDRDSVLQLLAPHCFGHETSDVVEPWCLFVYPPCY